MHDATLNRIARRLRTPGGPTLTGPTDHQLIDAFVTRGDHAAFAELVGRHGPLVLRVCRRVLPHVEDAEDAFQATFLVLARRAGSIRRREALGPWLHGVAHRVALRARRDAGRRRAREREARPVPSDCATREAQWREVQAVLDAEVLTLPEKYRTPFVLCFLEGRSRAEAAAELGLKEGTVWSRLSRARALLRARLGRRGIALSAVLAAFALSDETARGVPTRFLDSAVRAVLSPGGLSARVAVLARGAGGGVSAIAVVLGLVTTGLLALGGVVLQADAPAPSPAVTRVTSVDVPVGGFPLLDATRPPPAQDADDPTAAGRFRGRVVGPDGRPIAGARIHAVRFDGAGKGPGPVRGRSGADGRFEFDAPDLTYTELDGLPARRSVDVIAVADGVAPDWSYTSTYRWQGDPIRLRNAEAELRLARDDVPIRGLLLAPDGRPLAGARVRVTRLMIPRDRDLDAHLDREKKRSLLTSPESPPSIDPRVLGLTAETKTDAAGRFTVTGLGRDRLVALAISAPTVADTDLTVMTRDAPDVATLLDFEGRPTEVIRSANFTLQLKPGVTIRGIVRDRDTKAPIPGIWVTWRRDPLRDADAAADTPVTDADGRFTLTGLHTDFWTWGRSNHAVSAVPRPGSHHLMADAIAERGSDVVIECARGIPYRLKVVDEQGRPVEADVTYHYISPNPQVEDLIRTSFIVTHGSVMNRAARRADGAYEGFVLPGPGAVLVETPNRPYRPACVDPKAVFAPGRTAWTPQERLSAFGSLETLQIGGQWTDQHDYAAIVLVNPARGAAPLELTATVLPPRPRRVALVDPDGRPVVGARTEGLTWHPWDSEPRLRAAEFPLTDLHPDRPRRITFVEPDRRLIGFVMARGDGDAPYTVRMQPWGTVTGRLVDGDGQPVDDVTGFYLGGGGGFDPDPDPAVGQSGTVTVGETGRFRVERMVPGQRYTAEIYRKSAGHVGTAFEKLVVRPGEVRDLGDVRVAKPRPKD